MILEEIQPSSDNLELLLYWQQNISHLDAAAFPQESEKIMETCFRQAPLPPHFALVENTPIGFVYFREVRAPLSANIPQACAFYIMIAPEFQHKGYSNSLVALATELAHHAGW